MLRFPGGGRALSVEFDISFFGLSGVRGWALSSQLRLSKAEILSVLRLAEFWVPIDTQPCVQSSPKSQSNYRSDFGVIYYKTSRVKCKIRLAPYALENLLGYFSLGYEVT